MRRNRATFWRNSRKGSGNPDLQLKAVEYLGMQKNNGQLLIRDLCVEHRLCRSSPRACRPT